MINKYIIEFIGICVLLYSNISTDGDPFVMGFVTFAVFYMAKGITETYFTPMGAIVLSILEKISIEEAAYTTLIHLAAAVSIALTISPSRVHVH
jgi:hypothetical protein